MRSAAILAVWLIPVVALAGPLAVLDGGRAAAIVKADGLQAETLHGHDLWLPPSFVPANQDGEAVEHRLVSLDDAARVIANEDGPDVVTADASLVILDCLLRHGAIRADAPRRAALAALREPAA